MHQKEDMSVRSVSCLIMFFLGASSFLLSGCNRTPPLSHTRIITVEAAPKQSVLYFDSSIQAIRTFSLTSPIEGYVKKRFFFPGTVVAKDQLLFVIASEKMRDVYNDALVSYIKIVRDYNNNVQEMQGTEVLKKAGIISNEEYLAAKSKSQDINFERQQALNKLTGILNALQIPVNVIEKINPDEIKSIDDLQPKTTPSINIFSPATGIIYATPSSSSASSAAERGDISALSPGTVVRADTPLITIYDMSGISLPITVNEMQIDTIPEGAKVTITGDAFPDFVLKGEVHIKERLPKNDSQPGGGSASYIVYVDVPHLTLAQQALLRVGMSATAKIEIEQLESASIPLNAVYQKKTQSFVKRINPKTEEAEEWPVKVGKTDLVNIDIIEGLKAGDRILVNTP